MERLAALPLPVLKIILSLADDARHDAIAPREPHVPRALLERVELSHAPLWTPVVKLLREELAVALSITLELPLAARPTATLLDGVAWKRVPVRSLRLMLVRPSTAAATATTTGAEREPDETSDEMRDAWRHMFRQVPQLERLDLRSFSLDSPQLPMVVDAAARACPKLKALVLGTDFSVEPSISVDRHTMARVRTAVYDGLRRWREASHGGGLQQLEFPLRYAAHELDDLDKIQVMEAEFFTHLAQVCPTLEYFNAHGAPPELHAQLLRAKLALCPLAPWRRFCEACTALQHVDWIDFPYSDAHFEIFRATSKPHIRVLVFNGAEGEHTADAGGQSLYTSNGVVSVLEACASLRELRVRFDHSLSIPNGFLRQPLWNDAVLAGAARACPQLEAFTLLEYDQPAGGANIPTPIEAITDDGVSALATLAELRVVKMKATRVTGRGVFELLRHAPSRGPPRKVKLDVGCLLLEGFLDDDEEELVIFYDVVLTVLELLAQQPLAVAGRRFIATLRNRSRSDPDTDEWREKLHALVAAVPVDVDVQEEYGRIERIQLRSRN